MNLVKRTWILCAVIALPMVAWAQNGVKQDDWFVVSYNNGNGAATLRHRNVEYIAHCFVTISPDPGPDQETRHGGVKSGWAQNWATADYFPCKMLTGLVGKQVPNYSGKSVRGNSYSIELGGDSLFVRSRSTFAVPGGADSPLGTFYDIQRDTSLEQYTVDEAKVVQTHRRSSFSPMNH